MNVYQKTLFENLSQLCIVNDAFYSKDYTLENVKYRVFSYRLSSYGDWMFPSALECRGIMFELDSDDAFVRVASLPPAKFFNLNENPLAEEAMFDFDNIKAIMTKEDGSLISTFAHGTQLCFKSKTSINSSHAMDVVLHVESEEFDKEFKQEMRELSVANYTVNLEWCSPDNRIVLSYENPQLIVLNVRNNMDGTYMSDEAIRNMYPAIYANKVKGMDVNIINDNKSFIDGVIDMDLIEGFVIRFDNDHMVKVKTQWYNDRHRIKSAMNDKNIIISIVNESIDDVLSMFHDDELLVKKINETILEVRPIVNKVIDRVEAFYADYKSLTRKDYAVLAQDVIKLRGLHHSHLHPMMNLYLGKPVDWKMFFEKNVVEFFGDMINDR